MPLCVLLALKAPPFALLALPFVTQLHSDKLAWLHRWSGRIIYLLTVAHIATWSVQLTNDHRAGGAGGTAWGYVILYDKFIYAIIVSPLCCFCTTFPNTHSSDPLGVFMHDTPHGLVYFTNAAGLL